MKGIIIAGGKGTRLSPITKVVNKHLLPVYDRPMIYYPLKTLIDCGVKEILLISSPEHVNDFVEILGKGEEFGVKIHYEIQDEPKGIAHALSNARSFAHKSKTLVMLGDNIIFDPPKSVISAFRDKKSVSGAMVFLKKVADPTHFGIAEFNSEKQIIRIHEKPEKAPSEYAVIGMYAYDQDVFDVIEKTKPSERGEIEITDVNNYYALNGMLSYVVVEDLWIDAGSSLESLFEAGVMVRDKKVV